MDLLNLKTELLYEALNQLRNNNFLIIFFLLFRLIFTHYTSIMAQRISFLSNEKLIKTGSLGILLSHFSKLKTAIRTNTILKISAFLNCYHLEINSRSKIIAKWLINHFDQKHFFFFRSIQFTLLIFPLQFLIP